ncbi:L-aspartate oxidase [Microbacterium karelineae]|uniref:L-aspartate oxidase n=1 Tax=Microbacterium karelineae TaxID=2654283 RepID=UPI0018D35178|nr:L-aspartate oxidase [Microbacterium karelineae]
MTGSARRRVLVVGSGIAGLTAALHARDAGADATILTKSVASDAATAHAQGGIAGVVFPDDTHDAHAADTLRAAAGLADAAAVRALVEDGTHRVAELLDRGVRFDRDDAGRLARGLEAAHSVSRVLHAGGDATGAEIERALLASARAAGIEIIERATLVDLVRGAGSVAGARVMDPAGRTREIAADAVVLATGGAGRVYAHTTNPPVATGDGIAAAIRAGAAVRDMEFVQFHPTVLAAGDPFLVSEAVRGEGAALVDGTGRRFAFDAHPDGELAPRDVVARAIADCMARQEGRPALLDATALGAGFLSRRFPTIDRAVRERGLDWSREPIPVRPAAHYLMGGVATDLEGRTSLPGLFAAGEAARTGVHGANRLASNSLLEGAVFGARAGRAAARRARPGCTTTPILGLRGPESGSRRESAEIWRRRAAGTARFDREALGRLMWDRAGLARDGAGLDEAAERVDAWIAHLAAPTSHTAVEDRSLLVVAREIIRAARARSASVGAHLRTDDARVGQPA